MDLELNEYGYLKLVQQKRSIVSCWGLGQHVDYPLVMPYFCLNKIISKMLRMII